MQDLFTKNDVKKWGYKLAITPFLTKSGTYFSDFLKLKIDMVNQRKIKTKTHEEIKSNIITPILDDAVGVDGPFCLFQGRELSYEKIFFSIKISPDYIMAKDDFDEIKDPFIVVMVAKTEEGMNNEIYSCIGAMVAAYKVREHNRTDSVIYGIVTTGFIWDFFKLEEATNTIYRNERYMYLIEYPEICGIIRNMISNNTVK